MPIYRLQQTDDFEKRVREIEAGGERITQLTAGVDGEYVIVTEAGRVER